ncbi:hypothetical protein EV193_104122 [Herbihabitans rhizosphaerae]|uniref:YbaB/EbfC DNA-binding family protein n=1 Tax=Herbihabitans rhizosphaerae TaxID=1872711 RepID=A0A4Q7KSZ6_9PSEU|nr:hypothetical protein [Herbihabitans rhizosphaerae]RZS38911.1 hypothetical protein EV193_104122 [Herbihabitans rhizosphaerae]
MRDFSSYSVDELIEIADQPDRGALPAALRAVTGSASGSRVGGGVEVTVNLDGRIVGLELADSALTDMAALAAEIARLAGRATEAALEAGIALLAPVLGDQLTTELRAIVLPDEPAAPRPRVSPLDDRDDFSTVETWAV